MEMFTAFFTFSLIVSSFNFNSSMLCLVEVRWYCGRDLKEEKYTKKKQQSFNTNTSNNNLTYLILSTISTLCNAKIKIKMEMKKEKKKKISINKRKFSIYYARQMKIEKLCATRSTTSLREKQSERDREWEKERDMEKYSDNCLPKRWKRQIENFSSLRFQVQCHFKFTTIELSRLLFLFLLHDMLNKFNSKEKTLLKKKTLKKFN